MSMPDRLDDFEIVEEIGRGGFGVVYRARQISLDRPVALKVLYRNLIHTEDQISRFEREARAAARLDHSSIVSVYAWGEANDDFYIAQRLVGSGRTMADDLTGLREETTPPTGYFRRVAEQLATVAEALQQAHERGIVHRDVKPSNILLEDDGRPFLGDFGLAKVEDGLELSRTGDLTGSPYYMSPEQADSRRGEIGPLSDVYSLGVTLYECLTLTQPFKGLSSPEIVRRILTEDARRPSKLQVRVPADLETICLKAMEKNPDRRYCSAGDMAADLHAFLNGEPISAVPIGATTRLLRKAKRQRVPILVGAVGLLLTGLAIWYAISQKPTKGDILLDGVDKKARLTQELRVDIDEQIDEAILAGDLERVKDLHGTSKQLDQVEEELHNWAEGLVELGDSDVVQNATRAVEGVVDVESLFAFVADVADKAFQEPDRTRPVTLPQADEVAQATAEGLDGPVVGVPPMGEPTDATLATPADRLNFLYDAVMNSNLFASAEPSGDETDGTGALVPPKSPATDLTAGAPQGTTDPVPVSMPPPTRPGPLPRTRAPAIPAGSSGSAVDADSDVLRAESLPPWLEGLQPRTRVLLVGGQLVVLPADAPDPDAPSQG